MLVMETCGFLGNDAEIKEFNGKRYISFNVAASDRHTNANGAQVGINCHVRELQLLSGGSKTQTDGNASAQQPTATAQPQAQPAQPPYGATAAPASEKNDDLPF